MDKQFLEKPQFVVTDIENDFYTKWCGKIIDAKPAIKNGKPIFIIISSQHRIELNTIDLKYVEKIAKRMTYPKGRQAITSDSARIYIKEETDNEMLLGVVFHTRIKTFAQIYDKKKN